MRDRVDVITDLLLGAAYADEQLDEREQDKVRELLKELMSGDVPPGLDKRIEMFEPNDFDVYEAASAFADDSEDNKQKLIELIAAVHDADDELDLSEDEYLRQVAEALDIGEEMLADLVLDYEVEDLKDAFAELRAVPPPIPKT